MGESIDRMKAEVFQEKQFQDKKKQYRLASAARKERVPEAEDSLAPPEPASSIEAHEAIEAQGKEAQQRVLDAEAVWVQAMRDLAAVAYKKTTMPLPALPGAAAAAAGGAAAAPKEPGGA